MEIENIKDQAASFLGVTPDNVQQNVINLCQYYFELGRKEELTKKGEVLIRFKINPFPKPRMTRNGHWVSDRAKKYWEWKDAVKWIAKQKKYQLTETLNIHFIIPMPKSWSNKKKNTMNNRPHQQKPDVDNLVKAFMDALAENDQYVYDVKSIKKWGFEGEIIVKL